jgi:hypothetical protein
MESTDFRKWFVNRRRKSFRFAPLPRLTLFTPGLLALLVCKFTKSVGFCHMISAGSRRQCQ